jgi:FKBP-type peptidyl-prolyl cis-trans isomerase
MRVIGAAAVALALALAGCSAVLPNDPNAGSIDGITVGADDTGGPIFDFTLGLTYSKVQTKVLWEGTGDRLAEGDRILLDWYVVSLEDGAVIDDTYANLPRAYYLYPELIGQDLYNELVGERVGTRILQVSPPVKGYEDVGAVAVLADVLPARATGEQIANREGIPIVDLAPDGTPGVTIPDGFTPPEDLVVATRIQGSGEQVRSGSRILFNFLAVSLNTGEVIASSWDEGVGPMSAQVGTGELVPGLDQGLIDCTTGSQVLLLVPPALAWGQDSVVFVIDVLAVHSGG